MHASNSEEMRTMILSRMRPVHMRDPRIQRKKMEEIIQIMSLDLYRIEADSLQPHAEIDTVDKTPPVMSGKPCLQAPRDRIMFVEITVL